MNENHGITDKARQRQAEEGGKDLRKGLSTREFMYQLMTKESDVKKDYDAILVTGLGTRADLRIHLRKDGETIKSTAPSRLENYEVPEKEGGAIKHLLFQLLHRRSSRMLEKSVPSSYNSLEVDLSKKKDYEFKFILHDEVIDTQKVSKSLDFGETDRRLPEDPDYSQNPWE
jgi:hypothetical protein